MVGLTIGLLVVLAAMGSLIMIRSSARTMTDGTALEQQASLVMAQIGQQISQAGAINAYVEGNPPNNNIYYSSGNARGQVQITGIYMIPGTAVSPAEPVPNPVIPPKGTGGGGGNSPPNFNGYVQFDTRSTGVDTDNPSISVFGTDGVNSGPDTLYISYAGPNDGPTVPTVPSARNCIGHFARVVTGNNVPSIVSIFSIKSNTGNTHDSSDLVCGDGQNPAQPIASNVVDMQIKYWLNGRLQDAGTIAASAWAQVNGLEVCLAVQGEPTQAPQQTFGPGAACWNPTEVSYNDGRIHRFIKQTFYLHNNG
jgi:type II secretory pathway pseudopilin PulG